MKMVNSKQGDNVGYRSATSLTGPKVFTKKLPLKPTARPT